MSCQSCFENTLCYTAPSHGDWGIVRIAALVPEVHLLFVSPSACGRHGALGALQHGFKDRVSYLAITREDIIAGYDGLVEEAVAELLRRKKPTPRAIMIFVSCLDDLIGTDLDSLCLRLHAAHPETEFRPAHMNPITLDSKKAADGDYTGGHVFLPAPHRGSRSGGSTSWAIWTRWIPAASCFRC